MTEYCPHCQQVRNTCTRWSDGCVTGYRVRNTVCETCYVTIRSDLVHHAAAPKRDDKEIASS